MTKLRDVRLCGCVTRNEAVPFLQNTDTNCCPECQGASCAFVIQFPCSLPFATEQLQWASGVYAMFQNLVVRRRCFQGCEWVALFIGDSSQGYNYFYPFEKSPVKENLYLECPDYSATLAGLPSPFNSATTPPIVDPAKVTYPGGSWDLPNALWCSTSFSVDKSPFLPTTGTGSYFADSEDFPYDVYLCIHRVRQVENNAPAFNADPDLAFFGGFIPDSPVWSYSGPFLYVVAYDSWVHFQTTYKDFDGKLNTEWTFRVRIVLLLDCDSADETTPPTVLAGVAFYSEVQAGWEPPLNYFDRKNWVSGNPYLGETLEFEDGYYTAVPTYSEACENCFIRTRPSAFNIWYLEDYCDPFFLKCSYGEMNISATVNNTLASFTISGGVTSLTIYKPTFVGTGDAQVLAEYTGTPADCGQQSEMTLVSGDNSLLLAGNHWPEKVCISPATTIQRYQVCDTPEATCNCCDKGGDTLSFTMVLTGCGAVNGTYSFAAVRYRSPTPLPDGVSYPGSVPCGVFWYALNTGIICPSPGTGSGSVGWWGGEDGDEVQIGLLSWCDGTTYHVQAYCFNPELNTWVDQGEGTVSGYECRCDGTPRFAYELPELDCCCDATLIVTDCCPDGIPDVLAIEFFRSSDPSTIIGSGTITYSGGTWSGVVNFCGVDADVEMTCVTNEFGSNFNLFTSNGFSVNHSGLSCDPLEITFQTIMPSGDCFDEQIGANVT